MFVGPDETKTRSGRRALGSRYAELSKRCHFRRWRSPAGASCERDSNRAIAGLKLFRGDSASKQRSP